MGSRFRLACALLVAILFLLPALAGAQIAVPAWVQRYNGPGNNHDYAIAMAVDSSNNVIVTGFSIGSGGSFDYATIKYSSEGASRWTNRYNGSAHGADTASAVAVDGSNNVIVTGVVTTLTATDYATIKYSSAGVPLWTNHYNGPGNVNDEAFAIVVDSSNNVIVTGHSAQGTYPDYRYDYATIKYSSAGVPLWTNRYNGPGNDSDQARAIAVDRSNNVIVTGCSIGGGSNYDYTTIQYSSAGVPLWTNRYDGPGNGDDQASAVAVDSSNNIVVTGSSFGSGSGLDYATIQYSNAGVPLWTNRYNGPGNGDDRFPLIAVGRNDNVIVTGISYNGTNDDFATIQYSSAGVPLWTNRYNGPANGADISNIVAVDRNGNVIVTGISHNGTNYDYATIKYVLPPVIGSAGLTNGGFQVRLDDPAQAPMTIIEASTNLTAWTPVFTNTTPTNLLFYTEPNTSNFVSRYYRASDRW